MKFFYQDHANKPGIYKIINTHTNRIYVGQAQTFKKRWYGHKKSLLGNKHQNKFFQNDFNKCRQELENNDDFLEFHILEVMENSTKEDRNLKEEFYIISVFDKQEQCYNFQEKTKAKERFCHSYTPEETNKKLSEATKIQWQNLEIASKMNESRTLSLQDPEVIKARHEGQLKSWDNNSERKEKTAKRMEERLANPAIKEKQIAAMLEAQPRGRITYKERMKTDVDLRARMQEVGRVNIAKRNATQPVKIYGHLIAPDGRVFENVSHVPTFAKEHGLVKTLVYDLLLGKIKQHKGWKLHNPSNLQ